MWVSLYNTNGVICNGQSECAGQLFWGMPNGSMQPLADDGSLAGVSLVVTDRPPVPCFVFKGCFFEIKSCSFSP